MKAGLVLKVMDLLDDLDEGRLVLHDKGGGSCAHIDATLPLASAECQACRVKSLRYQIANEEAMPPRSR